MVATIIVDEDRTSWPTPPGFIRRLQFTQQPVGGANLTVQPIVSVLNDQGQVDTGFTGNINLSIAGMGVFSGVFSRPAPAGVVAFSGLTIQGNGAMRMIADSTGAMTATSEPFTITQ